MNLNIKYYFKNYTFLGGGFSSKVNIIIFPNMDLAADGQVNPKCMEILS